ncbi:exodeoxyribonuclease VII small subunit [Ruthenibacterium sp. CLA-JM-H11]|uniref:Exodeoxyribonuclease 7 small subunit n=1 Tax=Ruthenibacterium intestinale TaxID=3133163 RepID=A0ABV1GFW9_9FIRM
MKKKITFETASEELDQILRELSQEETTLDRSLELYAQAAELVAFCNETLANAQMKIDEITDRLETAISPKE